MWFFLGLGKHTFDGVGRETADVVKLVNVCEIAVFCAPGNDFFGLYLLYPAGVVVRGVAAGDADILG